jgi:hypothetical protein
MEDNSNVAVLADAKKEYTNYIIDVFRPGIFQGIQSLYEDSKDSCDQDNTPKDILKEFQNSLTRIPKWSQDLINKEFERIQNSSQWDCIDDLVTAVFVTHTKILSIIHGGKKGKRIDLKVPSAIHFMHLCYVECARKFWETPYLFCDAGTKYEYRNNMREAENIISTSIERTIRNKLPVRYILKEYLGNDYKSDDEDDNITEDDVKLAITNKQKNNILKLVKKELENMNGEINVNNESSIRKLIQDELQKISKTQENSNKKAKGQETTAEDVIEEIVEKVVAEAEAEAEEIKEEPTVEIKEEPTVEIKEEPIVEIKEETEEETIDTNNDTEGTIPDNVVQVEPPNEPELSKEIVLENRPAVRLENNNPKLEISELPDSDNALDNDSDNDLDNDLDNDSDVETKSEPDKFQVHSLDDMDFGTDFDTDDELESVDFEKQKNEVSEKSEFSFY